MLQRMIDETFGDLPGVTVIADNYVYGCNDRDHDDMMRISMLSCNVPVTPACTFTWISSSVPASRSPVT